MISSAIEEAMSPGFYPGDFEQVFAQGYLHISSSILTLIILTLVLLTTSVIFSFLSIFISIKGLDRMSMRLQKLPASQTLPLIDHDVVVIAFVSPQQPNKDIAKYFWLVLTSASIVCLSGGLEPPYHYTICSSLRVFEIVFYTISHQVSLCCLHLFI